MRFRRSLATAASFALLVIAPRAALAWDDLGHMVIVRIAWQQLPAAVRERVIATLLEAPSDAGLVELRPSGADPSREFMFAALASTWPDLIRHPDPAARHAYHRGDWHYIDLTWSTAPDGAAVPWTTRDPDAANIVVKLAALSAVIRDRGTDPGARAVALAWVLHLAGDLHQPLHASSRISDADPRGDHGAASFAIDSTMSLHWYWDRVLSARYPRLPDESRERYVARVTEAVLAHTGGDSLAARAGQLDFAVWARESLASAQRDVYCCGIAPWQPASDRYLAHADAIAEPRIALAGFRLAALLERIFAQ